MKNTKLLAVCALALILPVGTGSSSHVATIPMMPTAAVVRGKTLTGCPYPLADMTIGGKTRRVLVDTGAIMLYVSPLEIRAFQSETMEEPGEAPTVNVTCTFAGDSHE